jgi:hypothetical protein
LSLTEPSWKATMTTSTYFAPSLPQAARRAPARAVSLFGAARMLWARLNSTTPVPSRQADAAAVRTLALSVQATDPGFASDLFAAADRHEQQAD